MTTLIGTPTNLVVSGFRDSNGLGSFSMFDFTPVGVSVALIGLLFIGLFGWRIVPIRKQSSSGSFDTGTYFCEVRIVPGSIAEKKNLLQVSKILDESDAQVIGIIRGDTRLATRNRRRLLIANDILIIEIEPESLPKALRSLGLKLEEAVGTDNTEPEENETIEEVVENIESDEAEEGQPEKDPEPESSKTEEIVVQEVVVVPATSLVERTATDIDLPARYDVNLLAISRQGRRSIKRLRYTKFNEGDVLLLQGDPESIARFCSDFGCLPLAPRDIQVPKKGEALKAAVIMFLALLVVTFGLFPPEIAFVSAALAFALFKIVPLRSIYTSIDWPVVVLLAALFPVANAMYTTGAADIIASFLINNIAQNEPVLALALLLVVTMFLSDLMNNVATAAVMCPIGISTASQLGVSPDAFLMAIAIGASCAFLTPIGHQNNTLILGPGGFHFGDYWKLGLLLEIIVIAVSVPMLVWVWPL
ncbi:trkA-C domain protein [Vibrio ishigakensis]|uniref:TrkA-C domain protein n=1 Tax=Vibrio ishigakensis TaxID=1481914 RepID=A0A0B8QDU9_9VIBR|nr:trkA-C domain protein [Vibrio ishigakensis]